jgi:hypothetical protein
LPFPIPPTIFSEALQFFGVVLVIGGRAEKNDGNQFPRLFGKPDKEDPMSSTIANPSLIPDIEQTVSGSGKEKLETMLERIETALCRYFGEDEETILNSLRGL